MIKGESARRDKKQWGEGKKNAKQPEDERGRRDFPSRLLRGGTTSCLNQRLNVPVALSSLNLSLSPQCFCFSLILLNMHQPPRPSALCRTRPPCIMPLQSQPRIVRRTDVVSPVSLALNDVHIVGHKHKDLPSGRSCLRGRRDSNPRPPA